MSDEKPRRPNAQLLEADEHRYDTPDVEPASANEVRIASAYEGYLAVLPESSTTRFASRVRLNGEPMRMDGQASFRVKEANILHETETGEPVLYLHTEVEQ